MKEPCAYAATDISLLAMCESNPCPCQMALVMGCTCGLYHDRQRELHAADCKTKEKA